MSHSLLDAPKERRKLSSPKTDHSPKLSAPQPGPSKESILKHSADSNLRLSLAKLTVLLILFSIAYFFGGEKTLSAGLIVIGVFCAIEFSSFFLDYFLLKKKLSR